MSQAVIMGVLLGRSAEMHHQLNSTIVRTDELANPTVIRILHYRRNTPIKWRDSQALRYSISFPHKRLGPVCDSELHMLT